MDKDITIRITGEAGQGMKTIGTALCKIFKNAGYNIFANMDYMSRIRGGNNFFQIRIAEKRVFTLREKVDILVALNRESVELHKEGMAEKGLLILDMKEFGIEEKNPAFFNAPFYDIARKAGKEIFINSVTCGLVAGVIGLDFSHVSDVLKLIFSDKKEEIIKRNVEAAMEGYELAKKRSLRDSFRIEKADIKEDLLLNGNEAIALGAILAGCKFYTAYPMTPSTGIMNFIAHYGDRFNIVVEQAEDEVAAINMAIGASFAGARAMTSTSGGGFALMQEGISLAGMTETPIVVADAQRPAPATGLPTRTEQADLDFVIHSGHGEFAKAVFSPGTTEEAFYLTIKAFDLAYKYQIPVFILTDQHLADSYRNIKKLDTDKISIKRYVISKEDSVKVESYKRYLLTDSGISPRAVPSWIRDVVYADSDEHNEEGHITESGEIRNKMVEKRLYKKLAALTKEITEPSSHNLEGADIILIGFGSTYGVLKEACESAEGKKKIGFIHLSQVWPFPADKMRQLTGKTSAKLITVENNAGGQLAKLIRREAGIECDSSILKFDGRPFDLNFITNRIGEGI